MLPVAAAILLSFLSPAGNLDGRAGRRPFIPSPAAVVVRACPDCGRPMGRCLNLQTGESWPACSWCPVPRWR